MTGAAASTSPRGETSGILGYIPGMLMCLAGLAAMAFPVLGSLAVELTTAIAFLAAGLIGIAAFFRSGMRGEMAAELIAAVLYLIMGAVLLADPLTGLLSMTLFVAAAFVAAGIYRIVAAFRMKPAQGWGWVLTNGAVSVLLGLMLAAQFPVSGFWALGLLAGVNLLFGGMTMIAIRAAVSVDDRGGAGAPASDENAGKQAAATS